ncbi:MAG: hypothetical protein FWE06_03965 [Oscillospiraceae bacterium]|nr:hypothetical protein [Oscillospiraceae bacterium]
MKNKAGLYVKCLIIFALCFLPLVLASGCSASVGNYNIQFEVVPESNGVDSDQYATDDNNEMLNSYNEHDTKTTAPYFIVAYESIPFDTFYRFMHDPSKNTLVSSYANKRVFYGGTLPEVASTEAVDATATNIFDYNHVRLGASLVVDESLLQFIGDPATIQKLLTGNNVANRIETVTLLHSGGFPPAIWVKAEREHYFITIELNHIEPTPEELDLIWAGELVDFQFYEIEYIFHTQHNFTERFGGRSGRLIINNVDFTRRNQIMFYNETALLPILAISDALGFDVIRHRNGMVTILHNGREFLLDKAGISLIEMDTQWNYLVPTPGGHMWIDETSDDLLIDSLTLKWFYMSLGIEMYIDADRTTVTIG